MNKIKVQKDKLIFDKTIEKLPFNINIPLIVDAEFNCLLGNSLRDFVNDFVEVIVLDINCDFERNVLRDFEIDFVENIPQEKKYEIEKQISNYLYQFEFSVERISLFDDEELFENREINYNNFDKPSEYKFKKSKKQKESSDCENLFSFYGDEL